MRKISLAKPTAKLVVEFFAYRTEYKCSFVNRRCHDFVVDVVKQPHSKQLSRQLITSQAKRIIMNSSEVADASLISQLECLLGEDGCQPSTIESRRIPQNSTNQAPTQQPSVSIQQQINRLRRQLNESHDIFTNARDALDSISFEGVGQQIARQYQSEVVSASAGQHSDQKSTENFEINGGNCSEEIPPDATTAAFVKTLSQRVGTVPALATFFRVVGQLQSGIERIEQSHEQLRTLTESVDQAVRLDGDHVAQIRERVRTLAEAGGLSRAESANVELSVDEDIRSKAEKDVNVEWL